MPPIVLIWLALLAMPLTVLSSGAHGPTVQALQVELQSFHDYNGPTDGIYGPLTTAAVARFEQSLGLTQDGVAGPAVLGAIVAEVDKNAPTLQEGAQGAVVKDLQGLLQADGIPVAVDGDFGPSTQAAVQTLQARRGISTDGIVGPKTWQALFAHPYVVQSGDTLSGIAARYALPLQNLVAANGGKTSLQAGQNLLLAYAGWTAAAAGTQGSPAPAQPSPPPTGSGSSSSTVGTSTQSGSSGGSSSFIPAQDLAKWGSAGTPDISIVVLAQDQAAARALERGALPSGMLLALPQSLYGSAQGVKALLATAAGPKGKPTTVVWLGSSGSPDLTALLRAGVHVLIAPEVAAARLPALASGGASFVVPVRGSDLPALTALAASLQKAGYQFTPPVGF